MIHYIGDISFFGTFLNPPVMNNLFLFVKDVNEFKLRINKEIFSNITVFYVGDVAEVENVSLHSGFQGKIDYLFVHFMDEQKRNEILNVLSPSFGYYERHNYLKNLYKEIMDVGEDFFVYSPKTLIVYNDSDVILKDLSYFSLFTRKSILKDEDALIEKTTILAKNPDKIYISDNKENFIITSL